MNLWMMLGDHATTREAVRCTRSTDNPVAILGEYPDSATALEGLPRLQDDGLLLEATGTFGEGAEWRSIRGTHSESAVWRWRRITDPAPSLSKAWSPCSILRRFQAPDLANWSRQLRSADAWTPHTTACQQLASAPQRPEKPAIPLSDRERTILELLASGRTYQEISDRLTISKSSIYAYMARIHKQFLPQFRRPGVQSKRRLVVKLLP
jgi:DNA-binding CsgD family transcriptional regulator